MFKRVIFLFLTLVITTTTQAESLLIKAKGYVDVVNSKLVVPANVHH